MIRPGRIGLAAALLTGGCAHYAAAPLASVDTVLATPDMAIVAAQAAALDRPFLPPLAIDWTRPLTPAALAIVAVLENPDLKAQRARTGVVDAQAFAARLLPDPTTQGNFDKLLSGPDMFDAFAGQLAVDIGSIRKARVTREGGDADKRQVRLDLAWAEWQTAGQARLHAVRILALEQQRTLARQSAAATATLFEQASRAGGRGDLAAADVDTRRQSALDAADKARTIENDLAAARGELNHLLGLPPETTLALAPSADPAIPPTAAVLPRQAIARRLDFQALRAGYNAAEAEVHKAVLDQFPNLSLTLAGGRDTSDNYTLGPAVGFTLPLWNRNRGGIATATATRAQLKAEYDARLFQTRADIAAAVAGVGMVRRQKDDLLSKLPAIRQFANNAGRAAARGDLAPATAATAAQALRDRELTLSQLDQQLAEQTIALELLSGGPSEGWLR